MENLWNVPVGLRRPGLGPEGNVGGQQALASPGVAGTCLDRFPGRAPAVSLAH